jgi:hypothetical protein
MRDAISYPRPTASAEPHVDRGGTSRMGRPRRDPTEGAGQDRLTDRPADRPVLGEPRRPRGTRPSRAPSVPGARPSAATPIAARGATSPDFARLLQHLQTTVTRFVYARRAAGVAVERVITEVVCLVRESESCEGWRDSSERLTAQVVRWSIDAYHDAARRTTT